MPVIEVSFPKSLLRDLNYFAEYNDSDVDSIILWAVAEKMGELKERIVSIVLYEEVGNLDALVQRYPTIKKIIPQSDFILHFEFESGLEGTFDMKPLVQRKGIFSVLADPEIFKTLKVTENGKYIQWVDPQTKAVNSMGADLLYTHLWHKEQKIL